MATHEGPQPYSPDAAEFIHHAERNLPGPESADEQFARLLSEVRDDIGKGMNLSVEKERFKQLLLSKLEVAYELATSEKMKGEVKELQNDILVRYEDLLH